MWTSLYTSSYEVPLSGTLFHIRSGPPHLWTYSNCCQVCSLQVDIQQLFVLRGANKMDYILFLTIHQLLNINLLNFKSCSQNCCSELQNSAHRWQVHKNITVDFDKTKKLKVKNVFFYTLRVQYLIVFSFVNPYISRYIPIQCFLLSYKGIC